MNILYDKEGLYEEFVKLKKVMHDLHVENKKLKVKTAKDEKELAKRDEEISSLLYRLNSPSNKTERSSLVISLKERIDSIQKENKILKEDMEALKKNLRTSRIQKLEAEVKRYSEECTKLRSQLKKLTNNKPLKEIISNKLNLIKKLKVENTKLEEKIKESAKSVRKWKAQAKAEIPEPIFTRIKTLSKEQEALNRVNNHQSLFKELKKNKLNLESISKSYEQKIKELERKLHNLKTIQTVINKVDIENIITELRLNLMLANIEKSNIKPALFKNCNENDMLSIYEVTRILKRAPGLLRHEDAVKLSRFIIEPRAQIEIEYNELRKKKLINILKELNALIDEYSLKYNTKETKMSLLEKLGNKFELLGNVLQNYSKLNGKLTPKNFKEIFKELELELTRDESDYVLMTMYIQSKDVSKLNYEDLLESVGELLSSLIKEEEVSKLQNGQQELKKNPLVTNNEYVLDILQKLFIEIVSKLTSRGISFTSLIKGKTYKKKINDRIVELISYEDFEEVVKELGIKEFSDEEKRCLKNIQPDKLDNTFKVTDLIQILEDFIAHEESNDLAKKMNFEELSPISMVLLLALIEYLLNKNIDINDLLNTAIYKQPIQVDNEQYELDVINSKNFFSAINSIGIETNEEDHSNLKEFLAIDSSYEDKLSLDKLKAAIKSFMTNKELRLKAHKYFKEIVK